MREREAIIAAAHQAAIAMGDQRPSAQTVVEFVRRITGGRAFRKAEILAWLKSRGNRSGTGAGTIREPLVEHESVVSGTAREPVREPMRARAGTMSMASDIDNSVPVSPPTPPKSADRARSKDRLSSPAAQPVDFGDLESDVVRILALDRTTRRGAPVANERARAKLGRALEKFGREHLREGLAVAFERGKGVDYAFGVARSHAEEDGGQPDLFTAPAGIPAGTGRARGGIPSSQVDRDRGNFTRKA